LKNVNRNLLAKLCTNTKESVEKEKSTVFVINSMNKLETYAQEILPGVWLGSEDAGCVPVAELHGHNIHNVVVVGQGLAMPHTQVSQL
jgi:hypothetical protein